MSLLQFTAQSPTWICVTRGRSVPTAGQRRLGQKPPWSTTTVRTSARGFKLSWNLPAKSRFLFSCLNFGWRRQTFLIIYTLLDQSMTFSMEGGWKLFCLYKLFKCMLRLNMGKVKNKTKHEVRGCTSPCSEPKSRIQTAWKTPEFFLHWLCVMS